MVIVCVFGVGLQVDIIIILYKYWVYQYFWSRTFFGIASRIHLKIGFEKFEFDWTKLTGGERFKLNVFMKKCCFWGVHTYLNLNITKNCSESLYR